MHPILKYKLVTVIVGVLATIITVAKANEGSVVILVDPTQDEFTLPTELINFEEFKRKYEKQYENELEETFRQNLFNARLLRAFASAIQEKSANFNSLLSLDDRSDLTNEELARSLGDAPKKQASPDDLLSSLVLLANDEVGEEQKGEPSFDGLVSYASDNDDPAPEAESITITVTRETAPEQQQQPVVVLNRKKRALNDQEEPLMDDAAQVGGERAAGEQGSRPTAARSGLLSKFFKRDLVRSDLRRTGCLRPIQDQGPDCAVSYIFATLAAYEYQYCRMKLGKLEFAAQFPIDCGHLSGHLNGCQEADVARLISFVDKYGLEKRQDYSYYGQKLACPFTANAAPIDMGRFKVETNFERVSVDEFEKYLARSEPILVKLIVPDSFEGYAGGVDSRPVCDGSHGSVTMLLVGSGRENGLDYWLLRGSRSANWGEGGHYKLEQAASRCIADKGGLIVRPVSFKRNPWRQLITERRLPEGRLPVVIAS